jgi:hypothetical protein
MLFVVEIKTIIVIISVILDDFSNLNNQIALILHRALVFDSGAQPTKTFIHSFQIKR